MAWGLPQDGLDKAASLARVPIRYHRVLLELLGS
jgi:hypothetical protein